MGVGFVGRLLGLLLAAAFFSACGQVRDKTPPLEVVRTWKELAGQRVVGSGANAARVGIEARRCDEETGLLVYCLPVRPASGAVETMRPDSPLGPLAIRVVPLDRPDEKLRDALVKEKRELGPERVVFFAAGAGVGTQGRYRVEVTDAAGTVLAATTVEAVRTKGSPWLPMEVKELADDPKPNTYTVCQTAARPHWDGSVAMPPMERLPTFFPSAPDAGLDVSMQGGVVTVKSAKWVDRFFENHWLIRWWVNGRPVLRRGGVRPFPMAMEEMAERVVEPMEFSFILRMDPAVLGARPGDRVEFQLLYCADGIEFTQGDEEKMLALGGDAARLRMSRRVEWRP